MSEAQSTASLAWKTTLAYTLGGVAFGCAFPLIASLFDIRVNHLPFTWESLLQLQREQPLHWIIDMAPPVLGLCGYFLGRRQTYVIRINAELEVRVHERTAELEATNSQLRNEVAERRRTEQALIEAKQAADVATRAKSEFIANMSHEIRTPMTGIIGFAESLLDRNITDAERDEAVTTIHANSEHLLTIINDILDISKIEAGKLEVERVDCQPLRLASELISLMGPRAVQKGLRFDVDYEGPIPEIVQSDPTRLRQILINLVGNAIKFTEQGEITLVTRLIQHGPDGPQLEFSVRDSGIGMTDAQLQRLFQPFSQADSSTTRRFGGSGLGLVISKKLAEKLGGSIQVESASGRGTTFVVTISTGSLQEVPLIDNPREATAVSGVTRELPELVESVELNCRILLAEDNVVNQRLLSGILVKHAADVTLAENGRRALQVALEAWHGGNAFDVILMDIQMPEMDGYEACRELRARGYEGPIIALTANAMASDRKKCLHAGCNDYASKPIRREALLAQIQRQLHPLT